jgi:hypothetical protein
LTDDAVNVPLRYWNELKQRDLKKLCENAGAKAFPPKSLVMPFLGREIQVDRVDRCLRLLKQDKWERMDYPLLELLFLVYLLNAGPDSLSHEMISVQELKDSHFFQGPHEIKIGPLVERYGYDPNRFKKAAESLGGEAQDLADVAYKIPAFPKVPLYYLLWEGDDEFEPRLSILFDRSVEKHLQADAIWGLVNVVAEALLREGSGRFEPPAREIRKLEECTVT